MRLFVAIELPDSWKQALGTLQSDMQRALDADPSLAQTRVRWVRPDGIHLTLKFLGEVPADRLDAICDALTSAVAEPPGIELSLAHSGSFSDQRAPRVIWVTVDIAPESKLLYQLAERIETWLAAAGFPRERRAFAPHLTLARLPQELDAAARQRIAEITTAVAMPDAPAFVVEHVSLMRSHLGPGARYEQLAALRGDASRLQA